MKGQIYSLTNFFTEDRTEGNTVYLINQNGQELKTNRETINTAMSSADNYNKEEKVTQTELINLILSNARVAMTINYQKVNKPKSKKAYKEEMEEWLQELGPSIVNNGINNSLAIAEKKPLNFTPGEMRTIIGYPLGTYADNGLINFIDAEAKYMNKQVNPRTIEYVIVGDVKYIKK